MVRITESCITLHRLRFHAMHGVLPQERVVGNEYEVTVSMGCDLSEAALSDDVGDTVDYAEAYAVVKEQMLIPSQLMEHVALRMAEALLEKFPKADSVEVGITKLNPPMGAHCDGAEVKIKAVRQ